jgi:two-component system, NarL family, nitrate/nitrite response regulator NarL
MKIVIVDDHPLVRKGINSILSLEDNFEVVGEAGCVSDAEKLIFENKADAALIDLRLGNEDGLTIVKDTKATNTPCKFIVLTSSLVHDDFQRAEKCGISGYILKESLPDEIIYALNVINRGRKYFDPNVVDCVMKTKDYYIDDLTPREREILEALGKGLCNKEIAGRLFITESTVKKHISQILSKLNLTDRTQAALYFRDKNFAKLR